MKNLADYIASEMSSRIDSDEHKSIFGSVSMSKFAAKKDDDKEEDKDEKKDDKKDEDKKSDDKKDKKENPFAKKDDKKDDDSDDKKDDKKDDDKDDNKKEALLDIIDEIKALSSKLDSKFGFAKSSVHMIRTIEEIVSEASSHDPFETDKGPGSDDEIDLVDELKASQEGDRGDEESIGLMPEEDDEALSEEDAELLRAIDDLDLDSLEL